MNKEAFEKALDGRFSRLGAPDDMVGELVDWFEEYCKDNGVELFKSGLIDYLKEHSLCGKIR